MSERPALILTRGLPGSGKTTAARLRAEQLRAAGQRAGIVGRDPIRDSLAVVYGDHDGELLVTAVQRAAVRALLRAGASVIIDDLNLRGRYVTGWQLVAGQHGADVDFIDLTAVDVEECVRRDAERPASAPGRVTAARVGEDAIRSQHRRFLAGRPLPLPAPALHPRFIWGPYVPAEGTPAAVLVDLDGTVALNNGRDPYDETRVGEDLPNIPVITAVRAMHAAGHRVVYLSGRSAACRAATHAWLARHVGIPHEGLFMRPIGDSRKDVIVKMEIFDEEIRDKYRVVAVFDDRAAVVAGWRQIGLTVFQVAEGNF